MVWAGGALEVVSVLLEDDVYSDVVGVGDEVVEVDSEEDVLQEEDVVGHS